MEKTKILIVMQSMNVGGVERALLSLLSAIPEERYTVELVLSKATGEFLTRIPKYVNVSEAPYKKNIRSGEGIREISDNLKADRKYLIWLKLLAAAIINKRFRFDRPLIKILYRDNRKKYDYLFNFAGVNTLTHLLCKSLYKAINKYIWVHGDSDADGFMMYSDVYSAYNRIVCVSERVTEKFKKFMPEMADKADTIYNEIDRESILNHADENGLLRISNETIILTVGRLDVCKGYDIAIDACRKLLNDGYSIKWYIVGEGIERMKLEQDIQQKKVSDSFILLGLKENPYPYYRTTDIYVQTSISEGYCITLAEAKVFNKPIVTTDFSGAAEQIINGVNGYIVSANADSIAEGIEMLIDNKEIRMRFSKSLGHEDYNSAFARLEQLMNVDKNMKC